MTARVKIITWEITPYSPETSITDKFEEGMDPAILTASLHNIVQTTDRNYSQDMHLFSKDLATLTIYPTVFLVMVSGNYFGHVYLWRTEHSTNVLGLNTINSSNVVEVLLKSIQDHLETKYLRIIQPTPDIVEILVKHGYRLAKLLDDNNLIFNANLIGSTPLMKNLLLRENDYVKTVEIKRF